MLFEKHTTLMIFNGQPMIIPIDEAAIRYGYQWGIRQFELNQSGVLLNKSWNGPSHVGKGTLTPPQVSSEDVLRLRRRHRGGDILRWKSLHPHWSSSSSSSSSSSAAAAAAAAAISISITYHITSSPSSTNHASLSSSFGYWLVKVIPQTWLVLL